MGNSPAPAKELKSWKEIADYLDVTVRTAQRWEEERGLPVKRNPGRRGHITITVEELEEWKNSGEGAKKIQLRPLETTPGPATPIKMKAMGFGFLLPGRQALGWIALAAILLVSGGTAIHYWFFGPEAPATWMVQGNSLIVKDIEGEMVWRHVFEERMTESFYRPTEPHFPDPVWIGDLDGDGVREILVIFQGVDHSYLYCFSNRGRVRWRFAPGSEVTAGGAAIRGRFNVVNFKVAPMAMGRPNSVVVSVNHAGKWPSKITLLSPAGKVQGEYWHAGHLGYHALTLMAADLDDDGASEIYAGGFNAARGQATVVILHPDRMEGASQEESGRYRMDGMPTGREIARIFLGRSCVQEEVGDDYNFVGEIRFLRDGLRVDTVEAHDTPYIGSILYHLDVLFEIRHIQFSDKYQGAHNRLKRDGRLDHAFSRELEEERLRGLFRVVKDSR